jgi:UDP-2,3-diacylglucosamine hydrolase
MSDGTAGGRFETMDEHLQISSSDVFFVADAHFRDRELPGEAARRARFIRFTEHIPGDSTLFLLGDIFDFYFEYASVVPKPFFDIFYALESCRSRGIDIHFLGGNHDFWVDGFVTDSLGVRIHEDDFLVESQGRKIRCAHGDLTIPDDYGYRVLRWILRNRTVTKAAKLIHPDVMASIARHVSRRTKDRSRSAQEDIANRVAGLATHHCYNWGNDAFIMGHIHFPLHRVHDGRDFVIVGDWIGSFTYAHLHNGQISLEKFDG